MWNHQTTYPKPTSAAAIDSEVKDDNMDAVSPGTAQYDDPGSDFNDKQLNPDMKTIFLDDHIRWDDESEEQKLARTGATVRPPPKDSRHYDHDGNKPVVRPGFVASDSFSESSGDEPLYSGNGSQESFDRRDAGRLFTGREPQITNTTLAERRQARQQQKLALDTAQASDGRDEGRDAHNELISSATFLERLDALVPDGEVREELKHEFNRVNDAKNDLASRTMALYDKEHEDNQELMKDYFAGPAEERRRAREEAKLQRRKLRRDAKDNKIQKALTEELRATRLTAMSDRGYIDPGHWRVKSSEGLGNDDDDDCENDSSSDSDEEDEHEKGWRDDAEARPLASAAINFHAYRPVPTNRRFHDSTSTASIDKPLPAIPTADTRATLVSIQVMLRLLPVKVALMQYVCTTVEHRDRSPSISPSDKQAVYETHERVSSVCAYAEAHEAPWALQGRCSFYMGLAELLRSKVDGPDEEAAMRPLVAEWYVNAWNLCGGTYEEGAWAEAWARWLKGDHYLSLRTEGVEREEAEERKGNGEGLVGRLMRKMWNEGQKIVGTSSPVPISSSFDLRSGPGKGQELHGDGVAPSSLQRGGDAKDEKLSNIFGGLVNIGDLSKKHQKPVGLGIDIDDRNVGEPRSAVKVNAIPSPEGIFASPIRFANGWRRSPTSATDDRFVAHRTWLLPNGDFSFEPPRPSSPEVKKPRYRIVNPDPASHESTPETQQNDLPDPVSKVSPAHLPGGGMGESSMSLARRFSAAIFPTSEASGAMTKSHTAPAPELASPPGGAVSEIEGDGSGKRLSIAERRRASFATLSSLIRGGKAPARSMDDLAETGESPKHDKVDFEEGVKIGVQGAAKKSPLSPDDGYGEGLRRRSRRRSGRSADEMV